MLFSQGTAQCVDLSADGRLGAWECSVGQPNQRFALDGYTGMIVSAANGYRQEADLAGKCASAGTGAPDSRRHSAQK